MSVDNTTIGSPSGDRENRIRKGQIDWVVGLERASDYKSWSFKFKMGAEIYLSKDGRFLAKCLILLTLTMSLKHD